jgi:hypothetical protein
MAYELWELQATHHGWLEGQRGHSLSINEVLYPHLVNLDRGASAPEVVQDSMRAVAG